MRRWIASILMVVVFLAAAVPLIASGFMKGRGAADQVNYHERVIRKFAAEWPRPDLTDYASATTPLYHLIIAPVARFVTDDVRVWQAVGAIFTLLLLGALGWTLSHRGTPRRALLLGAPVLCSLYVFSSGVWLLPDNIAWLGVLVVLALCLRETFGGRDAVLATAALVVLVLARQSHLWLAGVIWAAAWLGRTPAYAADERLFGVFGRRFARTIATVVLTLPAFAAVAVFIRLWGGRLNPPCFDAWYTRHWTPQAPAFVLSLFGIYSAFFVGVFAPALLHGLRKRWWLGALACIGGLALAVIAPTVRDAPMGRYGGLWDLTRFAPAFEERSLLIVATSVWGAIAVLGWALALPWRARWILLAALAGFTAAQTRNPWLYQRYAEPLLLLLIALVACRVPAMDAAARGRGIVRAARAVGPALLALLLAGVSILELKRAAPVDEHPAGVIGLPPGATTKPEAQ